MISVDTLPDDVLLEIVSSLCDNVADLYIYKRPHSQLDWKENIENGLWLEMLRPLATVGNLHLSEQVALRIVPALKELVEGGTTEVLPALQNIFLERLES